MVHVSVGKAARHSIILVLLIGLLLGCGPGEYTSASRCTCDLVSAFVEGVLPAMASSALLAVKTVCASEAVLASVTLPGASAKASAWRAAGRAALH